MRDPSLQLCDPGIPLCDFGLQLCDFDLQLCDFGASTIGVHAIPRFGAGVARGLVGRGTIRVERFAMGMIVHGLPSNRDPLLGALLP